MGPYLNLDPQNSTKHNFIISSLKKVKREQLMKQIIKKVWKIAKNCLKPTVQKVAIEADWKGNFFSYILQLDNNAINL